MASQIVGGDQIAPLLIKFQYPLYQGDVLQLDFQLLSAAGVALDLTGTRWVFGIGLLGSLTAALTKDSAVGGQFVLDLTNKKAQLRLSGTETKALTAGIYRFDVQVKTAAGDGFPFAACDALVIKAPFSPTLQ